VDNVHDFDKPIPDYLEAHALANETAAAAFAKVAPDALDIVKAALSASYNAGYAEAMSAAIDFLKSHGFTKADLVTWDTP
jgi:hypothetical protein